MSERQVQPSTATDELIRTRQALLLGSVRIRRDVEMSRLEPLLSWQSDTDREGADLAPAGTGERDDPRAAACTAVVPGGGQASHHRLRGGTQNGAALRGPRRLHPTRAGACSSPASSPGSATFAAANRSTSVLRGRRRAADVQVLRDEAGVVEHLGLMARDNHQFAKFNKIGFDEHGDPRPDDLHLAWAAGTRVALLTPQ